jgi:hypothetical protein
MINDNFQISGKLDIKLNGKTERTIDNTVVTSGKQWVAARMIDTGGAHTIPGDMTHMGLGTSDANAASGGGGSLISETALSTELYRKSVTGDRGVQGTGADLNEVVFSCTYAPGEATGAIKEAGIFNDTTAGAMLARTTFPVVNKGALDTMTITWTITVS